MQEDAQQRLDPAFGISSLRARGQPLHLVVVPTSAYQVSCWRLWL